MLTLSPELKWEWWKEVNPFTFRSLRTTNANYSHSLGVRHFDTRDDLTNNSEREAESDPCVQWAQEPHPSKRINSFFHKEPNYLSTSKVDKKEKLFWELAAMVLDWPERDQLLAEIKCRHTDKEHHECSQNEREVVAEKGHFGLRILMPENALMCPSRGLYSKSVTPVLSMWTNVKWWGEGTMSGTEI